MFSDRGGAEFGTWQGVGVAGGGRGRAGSVARGQGT